MFGLDLKALTKEITEAVLTASEIPDILPTLESIDQKLGRIEKILEKIEKKL